MHLLSAITFPGSSVPGTLVQALGNTKLWEGFQGKSFMCSPVSLISEDKLFLTALLPTARLSCKGEAGMQLK